MRQSYQPQSGNILHCPLAHFYSAVDTNTIVVRTERIKTRGKWRTVELLACPVTWRPHPEQIASARRAYEDWWQALDWVRDGLIAGGMLRDMQVTAALPKVRPWGKM